MGTRPLVSVVIPTYNRPNQTQRAIESVRAQTFSDCEIIVVDDGSSAGAADAMRNFIKASGSDSVRYLYQPNAGPSAARNAGMALARGAYLAFLDSDDIWFPDKLKWQVQALQQYEAFCAASFTDAEIVDDTGLNGTTFRCFGRDYPRFIGIDCDAMMSLAQSFCGFWLSTLLVSTELAKQIGGFDTAIPFAEDRDFFFRLSRATSLLYVNKPLARTDRSSCAHVRERRSWDTTTVRLRGQQLMLEKWLAMSPLLPRRVRRLVESDLAAVHSAWTNVYLEGGDFRAARRSMIDALGFAAAPRLVAKAFLTWLAPWLLRRAPHRATSRAATPLPERVTQ